MKGSFPDNSNTALVDAYVYYIDKKAKRNKKGNWIEMHNKSVASDWERIAPSECHLKPGGGPIRIKIVKVKPNEKNS